MDDRCSRPDVEAALDALTEARANGLVAPSTVDNIRHWLLDPRYQSYSAEVARHIQDRRWSVLNEVFWKVIPFGTAGRRGTMYPIGTNAINEQTIGESAQGLANYLRCAHGGANHLRCAVAYDCRHLSREFAELCCEVLAAAGIQVCFLDEPRSTPELAYLVRQLGCHAGIMISASHNPPSDNAIKVFGPNGGQLRPPEDVILMQAVSEVDAVHRTGFQRAIKARQIDFCQAKMDRAYHQAVLAYRVAGPRELRILYSPLHGVGASSVLPVLKADGFEEVEVYAPQAPLDGDFPNVPGHVANPENPAVFAPLIERGREIGAHLILASDPDADRIGCAAPIADAQNWHVLSGNQIATLLADFILRKRKESGTLRADHYLVKTLVTSEILSRLAKHYGVRAIGDVLTGFKWLGGVIDELGTDRFLFAAEEAHGYLVGDYIRDKDAAGAAMLLAEMAAECHANGQTLHDALEQIFIRVGYHAEQSLSRVLPGAAGMFEMQQIMARLRSSPPASLGGMRVARVRDYLRNETIRPRLVRPGVPPADCDLIVFDLEKEGYTVAVRPSGTEPKLKCYLFAFEPPTGTAASVTMRREVAERLAQIEHDITAAFKLPASAMSPNADSIGIERNAIRI